MAKDKSKARVPIIHLHARISFLQQAATYLTVQGQITQDPEKSVSLEPRTDGGERKGQPKDQESGLINTAGAPKADGPKQHYAEVINKSQAGGLPSFLTSHLSQVARKSQIRLHTNIKHTTCKRCSTVLIEGSTCRKFVENLSKGDKKPHADVMVVECGGCGARKRWPIGAQRQMKRGERIAGSMESKKVPEERPQRASCEDERGERRTI